MDTESAPLIYKILPKITEEVEAISKTHKNPKQGYLFRGVDDVYNALNGLLGKHKITIVPMISNHKEEGVKSSSGNSGYRSLLWVTYRLYAEDGSFVDCNIMGEGIDYGDKSITKALAMAYKYMALQVFCIPLEEKVDTEYEEHSLVEETEAKPDTPKPALGFQKRQLQEQSEVRVSLFDSVKNGFAEQDSIFKLEKYLADNADDIRGFSPDQRKTLQEIYVQKKTEIMGVTNG